MTVDELNRLHGKFLGVWSRVGPELCDRYGMKFVTTNILRKTEQISFHYILLLDGSGSMIGQPWKDLLNAVKEFLICRLARNSADRVSILVFSGQAKIIYFNQPMSNIDLSKIIFPEGSTSFANAFATVHNVIKHAQEQTPNDTQIGYAIVFMSDGQAFYPQYELNALLTDYKMLIKRFWTVALGQNQMNILEKINKTMGGMFFDVKNSGDLIETFAEIARIHIS